MSKIFVSVCSLSEKRPESLKSIVHYGVPGVMTTSIEWDAPSIYQGHWKNISRTAKEDDDIIVMCHDDIDIISKHEDFYRYLELVNKPGVGFIGVAGSTSFDKERLQGAWWNARHFGEARGFVFQGSDPLTMAPNYFGSSGKVVVLDGCFLACSYKTLKVVGLDKPSYLSSDWDFYDIHLTSKAFLQGLDNYVVPIIIRHDSPGNMREGWFKAKDEFFKHHYQNLPLKIPVAATNGLPK